MTTKTTNKGVYWGYHTELEVTTSKGSLIFSDNNPIGYGGKIDFTAPFNTDGSLNYITVTLYNLSKDHLDAVRNKMAFTLKSGPEDLFGLLTEGTIIQREEEQRDNLDYPLKLKCLGGKDYSKTAAIYSYSSTVETKKKSFTIKKGEVVKYNTKKRKKVRLSFKKNTKASTIIKRVCRQANIKLAHMWLKKDKVFTSSYTVSSKPYNELKKLAKACGSKLYYRRDGLVMDDFSKADPYKEHIYVTSVNGLLNEPVLNDDDEGGQTYTLTMPLDPRVDAGSVIEVKSDTLTGFVRVISGQHSSEDYTTECEVKLID